MHEESVAAGLGRAGCQPPLCIPGVRVRAMLVAWKMQRRRLQEGVRASWRSREGKVAQKGLGIEGKNMWWREERKHTQHTRKKEKKVGE